MKFNCGSKVVYNHHHLGEVCAYIVKVVDEVRVCGDPFSEVGLSEHLRRTYYDIKYLNNGVTYTKHGIPEMYLMKV